MPDPQPAINLPQTRLAIFLVYGVKVGPAHAARVRRVCGNLLDETHGFRYVDLRDLTGFVNGTENPDGDAGLAATIIGDEDRAFAGGSYISPQACQNGTLAQSATSVATAYTSDIGRACAWVNSFPPVPW